MTDKEAKIQLALGTLPEDEFYKLASTSSDPTILKALAKAFSKQTIADKFHADNITSAFLNNYHMPQKLKNFVLLSRRLQTNLNVMHHFFESRSKVEIEKMEMQLDKLSKELFDDK